MYILSNKLIAFRSYDMDYEELLEELLNSGEKVSDDFNLTKETVGLLLNSIDSAWDKKVVKYVLSSTRSQIENLGIGDRRSRTVEEVSTEENFSMAVDEVDITLQNGK